MRICFHLGEPQREACEEAFVSEQMSEICRTKMATFCIYQYRLPVRSAKDERTVTTTKCMRLVTEGYMYTNVLIYTRLLAEQ